MSMIQYKILIFMLMLAPFCVESKVLVAKPIFSINTSQSMPPYVTDSRDGFEDLLANELYSRLGFSIVINHIPSERGLKNLNDGIDDGILSRIGGLRDYYPNIIQINEVAIEWQFVAFVKRNDIHLEGWEDFSPYNVALVKGWKIFEHNIKHYKSLITVRKAAQLFRLLDSDRVDVVVYALRPGLFSLDSLGINGVHAIRPVLAKKKKYFYVSKKHQALASLAVAELKKIKHDGTYDRLIKATILDKGIK